MEDEEYEKLRKRIIDMLYLVTPIIATLSIEDVIERRKKKEKNGE